MRMNKEGQGWGLSKRICEEREYESALVAELSQWPLWRQGEAGHMDRLKALDMTRRVIDRLTNQLPERGN